MQSYLQENFFTLVNEYIDDGYTGTNFDRPGFKKMIRDIENNLINCVITKDMSRLGRDYIGVGNYLEKFFPEHNVRFIAINDNIDTFNNKDDDLTPFKAIINDYYAKDISKKVKSALIAKKKAGQFLGGIAPYGYCFKSPTNHKSLVIDKSTAFVVKKIFKLYLNGFSLQKIAQTLDREKIPIPSIQKNLQRGVKSLTYGYWNPRTIDEILKNPTYIGNLAQNKRQKVNYKSKKVIRLPQEKWIIVENTHEAIISKNTFLKVQNIYAKNKNLKRSKNNLLFAGFLYCQECGHRIGINKSNGKYYCACNYYRRFNKLNICTPHAMRYDNLEAILLKELTKEWQKNINKDTLIAKLKQHDLAAKSKTTILKEIQKNTNLIKENKIALENLYIEYLKKHLTSKLYKKIYLKLTKEICNLTKSIKLLKNKLNNYNKIPLYYWNLVNAFISFKNPSRELLANLIDKIKIDKDKNITIFYKIKRTNFLEV